MRPLPLLLSLCAAPALAEAPRVVTDIAPVHALVAAVMADVGTPTLLLPPGGSAHGHQLRPSEAADLAAADLLFWIGPELTPWLEAAAPTLSGNSVSVPLIDLQGTHLRELAEEDEEEHHTGDRHDHDGVDPHAWLDPQNALIWLPEIARQLADADPQNAARYRANANAMMEDVTRAADTAADRLSGITGGFIVYHDAYGYFTDRFGLPQAASIADSDAVQSGARHLAELQGMAKEQDIRCLFTEPQFDGAVAQKLAASLGLQVGVLDPLGAGLEPGAALYPALITGMADALAGCMAADR